MLSKQEETTPANKLYLKLAQNNKEALNKILKLLQSNPGKIPVCLFFEDSKKLFKLSQEYNVNNSQLFFQNITALLGQNNVKWQ
jgi:DNA polymerase-3 subunit alpha